MTGEPTIEETIRAVLAEHGHLAVGPDEVGETSDLFDAGMTSHASVNVMLALEEHFDVEFPEDLLRRSTFESVAALREVLTQLVAG